MHATWVSFLAVLVLAGVHMFGARGEQPRRRRSLWLSVAGGVTIAYILVELLPDLAHQQIAFAQAREWHPLIPVERQVYLAALAGLVATYGLEAVTGRDPGRGRSRFALDVVPFAVYSAIIGYFGATERRPLALALAVLAFGAHFLVKDTDLRRKHGPPFDRIGRPVLAGAVLAGWALGAAVQLAGQLLALLFGFLAGGILLNALNEELPGERESRFLAFAGVAVAFSCLLVAMESALAGAR